MHHVLPVGVLDHRNATAGGSAGPGSPRLLWSLFCQLAVGHVATVALSGQTKPRLCGGTVASISFKAALRASSGSLSRLQSAVFGRYQTRGTSRTTWRLHENGSGFITSDLLRVCPSVSLIDTDGHSEERLLADQTR